MTKESGVRRLFIDFLENLTWRGNLDCFKPLRKIFLAFNIDACARCIEDIKNKLKNYLHRKGWVV